MKKLGHPRIKRIPPNIEMIHVFDTINKKITMCIVRTSYNFFVKKC